MLTQIHIRDLATIEELHLCLTKGNTMITGETGAGKSVFIEAIELGLGSRASHTIIRPGKDKADISLCFDVRHFPHVIEKLITLDLYQDNNECIIRRIITSDGRSRCYINGLPATVQIIREMGELLFHLHSQHEQQVLLKAETQREMLDRFADHLPLAAEVTKTADAIKETEHAIAMLRTKMQERTARTEFLRFQLDELEGLKLNAGEWETLEVEHHRLTHAEDLLRNIQQVLQYFTGDEATIFSSLNDIRKTFETISPMEAKAKVWLQNLESAAIQLQELESDLQNYLGDTDLDPERLQLIEERVSQIFNLSRKHKIKPEELVTFQQTLATELQALNASDEDLALLEKKRNELQTAYTQLAEKLSLGRKKAATKLQTEITATIRSLSLPHGDFKINLELETNAYSPYGMDKITFLIKTNPDQSLQSLKMISGGELSRLSLAAHLALASRNAIPTLIFDEVDTGLSGATAVKIGKLLRKLGDSYQVFCITHQPQVAACGHQQILVEKYFMNNTTHTRLRLLDEQERIREIARLLGGEKITAKTIAHAQEVLANIYILLMLIQ